MPWSLFDRIESELLRDPFAELFSGFPGGRSRRSGTPHSVIAPLNVRLGDDDVIVEVVRPGLRPEDFEIALEENKLRISGGDGGPEPSEDVRYHLRERPRARFERYVSLPYRVDADRVEATYELGVLRIRLPRAESDKPRTIPIRTGTPAIEGRAERVTERTDAPTASPEETSTED
ncbi:MAG TPA: Hsp20/alpha crystallin family protein [Planctomycetota bacterium]|nr:Hsp20/alpha crystallin family protein [Planctomycetota bacterium]